MIALNATHQQTQRVVDPVVGTYQTVLTIDPSVGQSDIVGAYNCTVENARGRSLGIYSFCISQWLVNFIQTLSLLLDDQICGIYINYHHQLITSVYLSQNLSKL